MRAVSDLIEILYWNHTAINMKPHKQPDKQLVRHAVSQPDLKAGGKKQPVKQTNSEPVNESIMQPDTLGLGTILGGLSIGTALCSTPMSSSENRRRDSSRSRTRSLSRSRNKKKEDVEKQQQNEEQKKQEGKYDNHLPESFFSKRVKSNLKRTKSVTKLDRKRVLGFTGDLEGYDSPSNTVGGDYFPDDADSPNTSGGSPKFLHTLKRTMSVGRLARQRRYWQQRSMSVSHGGGAKTGAMSPSQLTEHDIGLLINTRMRASRSHESLLTTPASLHSIDLSAPDVEIRPLHSSMLGQEHCFQVSTANGSKYYSCRSAAERQAWMAQLRRAVTPRQEATRRTDQSLRLWLLEAKNVPAKKRYFCEVCLDDTLYARTSSKPKVDMLFWGEQFDFTNLPEVEKVTVNIYREADRKKKREKNQLLGYINIPVSEISGRSLVERWYPAASATVGKAGREKPRDELLQVRIKARYQQVHILPTPQYAELIKYISADYLVVVEVLEPVISVKQKEELAACLVAVLHKHSPPAARDFLTDIVMAEVDKLENDNLAFRGNSIATKAVEAFMKLVGDKYLHDTLADFIRTMLDGSDDCEVDPTKVGNNTALQRHQTNLVMYCEMAWFKIINSHCYFPQELKAVFGSLRERCDDRKRGDVADNLISACIFLRFLCPAIMSPSLFSLTQEFPQDKAARNLTLIAKVVQSLANFTKFGAKEEFMGFLNSFVEREMDSMKSFLGNISTVSEAEAGDADCVGDDADASYIDLGRELSVLHTVLAESLDKVTSDTTSQKLSALRGILDRITSALEEPSSSAGGSPQQTQRIYDNVSAALPPQTPTTIPNTVTLSVEQTTLSQQYSSHYYQSTELGQYTVSGSENTPPPTRQYPHVQGTVSSSSEQGQYSQSQQVNGQYSQSYQHPTTNESSGDIKTVSVIETISNAATARTVHTSRTVRGFDNPHRNGGSSVNSSSRDLRMTSSTRELNATDDYVLFTSVETSPPDHLSDERLAPSHSTPSMRRPDEKIINQSWEKMVVAAELAAGDPSSGASLAGEDDLVDLMSLMDGSIVGAGNSSVSAGGQNSSSEFDYTGADEASQLSTVASSGYQSLAGGYSASSSPVDSLQHDSAPTSSQQPLSFSNPMFGCSSSYSTYSSQPRAVFGSPGLSRRQNGSLPAKSSHQRSQHGKSKGRSSSTSSNDSSLQSPPSPHHTHHLSQLSRSVDFVASNNGTGTGSPVSGMKRTVTDQAISSHSTPTHPPPAGYSSLPGSVTGSPYGFLGSRPGAATTGNTVRMGVSSMTRRLKEQEKTKGEYEAELGELRRQLADTQRMLSETHGRLVAEEVDRKQVIAAAGSSQSDAAAGAEDPGHVQEIITRSLSKLAETEEALRSEQRQLQTVVSEKQRIIDDQERRIQALDAANNQLLSTLNVLKERYNGNHQGNHRHGNGTTKLSLVPTENGQFKTSSC